MTNRRPIAQLAPRTSTATRLTSSCASLPLRGCSPRSACAAVTSARQSAPGFRAHLQRTTTWTFTLAAVIVARYALGSTSMCGSTPAWHGQLVAVVDRRKHRVAQTPCVHARGGSSAREAAARPRPGHTSPQGRSVAPAWRPQGVQNRARDAVATTQLVAKGGRGKRRAATTTSSEPGRGHLICRRRLCTECSGPAAPSCATPIKAGRRVQASCRRRPALCGGTRHRSKMFHPC